jgi:hypothetical protein
MGVLARWGRTTIALAGEITEYQPRIEPRQRVVPVGDQPLQRGDKKLVDAGLLFGVHGSLPFH